MRAYHKDPALKLAFLTKIEDQRNALIMAKESLFPGMYDPKLANQDWLLSESQAGIPGILTQMGRTVFNGLHSRWSAAFPTRFADAPRGGADLSMVGPRFLLWLLRDSGIPGRNHPDVAPAFRECVDVMQSWCDLGIPDGSAAFRAREAIRDHAHENSAVVMEPAGGAARAAEHAMHVAIGTYLQRPSRAIDSAVWSILGADNAVSANAQSAHEIANITNRSRALLEFYMTAAIKLLELMEMAPIAD